MYTQWFQLAIQMRGADQDGACHAYCWQTAGEYRAAWFLSGEARQIREVLSTFSIAGTQLSFSPIACRILPASILAIESATDRWLCALQFLEDALSEQEYATADRPVSAVIREVTERSAWLCLKLALTDPLSLQPQDARSMSGTTDQLRCGASPTGAAWVN